MEWNSALEKTSNRLQNLLEDSKTEQPPEESYRSFTIEPEDEIYDDHVRHLNSEKGMDVSYGDSVIHICGPEDATIYSGPMADQLERKEEYIPEGT